MLQNACPAADVALSGDEVVVYPGIYREALNPVHAGTPVIFDTDYFESTVGSQVICGPFADRSSWENEICVWQDQM